MKKRAGENGDLNNRSLSLTPVSQVMEFNNILMTWSPMEFLQEGEGKNSIRSW
jgi:hypothetical protein